jgi:mono/diheme cytochrome c family protein
MTARARALAIAFALVAGACTKHPPPPQRDAEVDALRERGRGLFYARAGCSTCHRVGDRGEQIVGPNLGIGDGQAMPVGARVRHDGLYGVEYVVESIVDPDAYVVAGYARGVMKPYEEPPIALTDEEILAIAAFIAGEGDASPIVDRAALERGRKRIQLSREARRERTATAVP